MWRFTDRACDYGNENSGVSTLYPTPLTSLFFAFDLIFIIRFIHFAAIGLRILWKLLK